MATAAEAGLLQKVAEREDAIAPEGNENASWGVVLAWEKWDDPPRILAPRSAKPSLIGYSPESEAKPSASFSKYAARCKGSRHSILNAAKSSKSSVEGISRMS